MRWSSFGIAESIVIVLVVVFLFALGLPAISRWRMISRLNECENNLRQIGLGLLIHADRDPLKRYCSGAYDWYHDGCPDSVGWVADLVNMNIARPIDLLCPANPMRGNEQLVELYTKSYLQTESGNPNPQHATAGVCGTTTWGPPSTADRVAAIEKYLLDKGYDSNYTASWYLVRGHPKVTIETLSTSQGVATITQVRIVPIAGRADWRSLGCTEGPLRWTDAEQSKIHSGNIPLLADGNGGDSSYAVAGVDLSYHNQRHVANGDGLVVSFNAGPSVCDGSTIKPLAGNCLLGQISRRGTQSVEYSGQIYEEVAGYSTGAYGSVTLQDTRGWYCHHQGVCNILVADGSVRHFHDTNEDGLLNPGFRFDKSWSSADASIGYFDSKEDLPRGEVFSGIWIRKLNRGLPCNL
jgi:hypothetical protein